MAIPPTWFKSSEADVGRIPLLYLGRTNRPSLRSGLTETITLARKGNQDFFEKKGWAKPTLHSRETTITLIAKEPPVALGSPEPTSPALLAE